MSKRAAGGRKSLAITMQHTDKFMRDPETGQEIWGDLDFNVPMIPPSVNHYVKHTRTGGHYVTKAAESFIEAVGLFSKNQCVRYDSYFVEIFLNLGPKQKMDVDNCAKVVLDALAKNRIIHSDAAVTDLTLHKRRAAQSSTNITIWQPSHDVVSKALAGKKGREG